MKYRTVYTKSKKNAVKKRLANGESIASLAKEFDIPYGTIGRWQWNMRGGKHIEKAYEKATKVNSNPGGLSIDWNKALTKTVIDMGLNAVNARREAKRQRLIAYLIGVVVGMAIGSLIMRALQ